MINIVYIFTFAATLDSTSSSSASSPNDSKLKFLWRKIWIQVKEMTRNDKYKHLKKNYLTNTYESSQGKWFAAIFHN